MKCLHVLSTVWNYLDTAVSKSRVVWPVFILTLRRSPDCCYLIIWFPILIRRCLYTKSVHWCYKTALCLLMVRAVLVLKAWMPSARHMAAKPYSYPYLGYMLECPLHDCINHFPRKVKGYSGENHDYMKFPTSLKCNDNRRSSLRLVWLFVDFVYLLRMALMEKWC